MEEVEIRTQVDEKDIDTVLENLKSNGFSCKKTVVQHDMVFDKPDASLFKNGCKIRYRIEGDKRELTYKGTMLGSSEISKRTETNIPVGNVNEEVVKEFLSALGYPLLFQVKKERKVFAVKDVEISVDKWPIIGYLVEIEGPEEKIKKVAKLVAPNHVFGNKRLKDYFSMEIEKQQKPLSQLISEYEKETGFYLGNLALSLGI